MVSIVICNRSNRISPVLEKNISETIGIEYEVVCIDNSKNQYNIFQAYNIGVAKARYPLICFMHDDILYHTIDWGKKLLQHFQDPSVGMVGIAGPTYISKFPGIWWGINHKDNQTNSTRQYNLDTDRFNRSDHHLTLNNPYKESVSDVVALDGLFFCIPKKLFEKISFDESFGGFHFYDIDISIQIKQLGYRNLCIYDILVEHISTSNLSKEWIFASRKFFSKWKHELPISTYFYNQKQIVKMEENNLQTMLNILSANQISFFKYYSLREILEIPFKCKAFVLKKILKKLC